jgi:hypothetical protein
VISPAAAFTATGDLAHAWSVSASWIAQLGQILVAGAGEVRGGTSARNYHG